MEKIRQLLRNLFESAKAIFVPYLVGLFGVGGVCAVLLKLDGKQAFLTIIAIALIAISYHCIICNYPPVLLKAISKAKKAYGRHIINAYHQSKPIFVEWKEKGKWERLTAAVLNGIAKDEVLAYQCVDGDKSNPIIFCNFQAYAYAVTEVLNGLAAMGKFSGAFPQIYTILKRPVCEWYNTFPYSTDSLKAQRTFKWWEDYKTDVASLRKSRFRFYRIVAHIERENSPADPKEYYLFSDEALVIEKARDEADKFLNVVEWHPMIQQFLSNYTPQNLISSPDIKFYLIGKPLNNEVRPGESRNLIKHFEERYHTYKGKNDKKKPGVHIGYIYGAEDLNSELFEYDDVFIVRMSETRAFGLVFINEKLRDINGMRILPEADLKESGDALLSQLIDAWEKVESDYRNPGKPEDETRP